MSCLDRPTPGHAAPCVACVHRLPDLSHPSPCGYFRGDVGRHVKPNLVVGDGGVTCEQFVPLEGSGQ